MNRIRQFCAATVLTLFFTFTCVAGEMRTGISDSPPENRASLTGYIDTPSTTDSETSNSETPATGSAIELALYFFDSMMTSVF